ncbi:unnamed protein product [Paramecium octaurelia]|uniref:Uncharacterized protein n=1 Tax=Paramecium octaurelia TaxID=43137 RepID=A0A8S1T936_PAROT|nr:unnamed protein product [Paramecium octaurelia]
MVTQPSSISSTNMLTWVVQFIHFSLLQIMFQQWIGQMLSFLWIIQHFTMAITNHNLNLCIILHLQVYYYIKKCQFNAHKLTHILQQIIKHAGCPLKRRISLFQYEYTLVFKVDFSYRNTKEGWHEVSQVESTYEESNISVYTEFATRKIGLNLTLLKHDGTNKIIIDK